MEDSLIRGRRITKPRKRPPETANDHMSAAYMELAWTCIIGQSLDVRTPASGTNLSREWIGYQI